MVKRPKWSKKSGDPGEPADRFTELARRYRPWLKRIPDDPYCDFNDERIRAFDEWLKALEDIDQRNDVTQLVTLLRQVNFPIPDDARIHLADLLSRYQLKRKRGAQKTPSYERTETDIALDEADFEVRTLISQGIRVKDALARVSELSGIPIQVLTKKHRGIR